MDADQPWTQTRHGRRPAMDADQPWTQTSHGRRPAVDPYPPWTQTHHGRRPRHFKADTDPSWTQTRHGRRPAMDADLWSMTIFSADPYAYTNTNILRSYALLHREHGLWTSYWNPLRALLADQNNPLSNFYMSTIILPHIIEHPCDPDSPDFYLN